MEIGRAEEVSKLGKVGIENVEDSFYADSERSFAEGPQWDEPEVEKSENSDSLSVSFREEEMDYSEYMNDGTRELSEDEKQKLKDALGWSDDKLKKCTIDENGNVIIRQIDAIWRVRLLKMEFHMKGIR